MDDHFDICRVFEISKFDIARLTCIVIISLPIKLNMCWGCSKEMVLIYLTQDIQLFGLRNKNHPYIVYIFYIFRHTSGLIVMEVSKYINLQK